MAHLNDPGGAHGAATASISVIDIAPFLSVADSARAGKALSAEADEVVRQWRMAFSTCGFAQVAGHGVPATVIEEAYRAARKFFTLTPEEKQRYNKGRGYGFGGFVPQGVERVSATVSAPDGSELGAKRHKPRPPDLVENIVFEDKPEKDVLPDVPGFETAVRAYHAALVELLRAVMALTALALDLPATHFETYYFDAEGKHAGETSLRLAHYAPQKEDPLPGQLRYGEHTDYTGFTILWQDHNKAGLQTADEIDAPAGGLQVRMPDGSWIDVPPVAGAFTVNAGDLIQVWTNDVFLSNTHRVINPPRDAAGSDRISMVFFTGPAPEAVVECLPTCVDAQRPARYQPITSGEHLRRKLRASNL